MQFDSKPLEEQIAIVRLIANTPQLADKYEREIREKYITQVLVETIKHRKITW